MSQHQGLSINNFRVEIGVVFFSNWILRLEGKSEIGDLVKNARFVAMSRDPYVLEVVSEAPNVMKHTLCMSNTKTERHE